jgi:predicted MPP superfamily phosphohydrolase
MQSSITRSITTRFDARGAWILLAINLLCLLAIVLEAKATRAIARKRALAPDRAQDTALLATTLILNAADWVLLWALPQLKLSFSESIAVPGLITLLLRLLFVWSLQTARLLSYWRKPLGGQDKQAKLTLALFLALSLGLSAAQIDAYVVEPLLIETTELSLAFKDLRTDAPPIRVVHITDTHIERNSYREATIVRQVNALEPDLIVLTGDYLNLSRLTDPISAEHWRKLVSQLDAPYGIYATRGTVEPTPAYMRALVAGTKVTWLEQQTVRMDIRGQEITLAGVACSHHQEIDQARLYETLEDVPESAFTLLLYHSPDLIAEAAQAKIDLYLGGHTHGGQIRLPLIGPLVTGSQYGRQYVNGLFERGHTTMYISRGLGFEGGASPRARFLCRPEIVSLELRGSERTQTSP